MCGGVCSQCHCAGGTRSGLLSWRARALRRVPRTREVGKRVKGERRSGNGSVNAERRIGLRTLCGAICVSFPAAQLRAPPGRWPTSPASGSTPAPGAGGGRTVYSGNARWDGAPQRRLRRGTTFCSEPLLDHLLAARACFKRTVAQLLGDGSSCQIGKSETPKGPRAK